MKSNSELFIEQRELEQTRYEGGPERMAEHQRDYEYFLNSSAHTTKPTAVKEKKEDEL